MTAVLIVTIISITFVVLFFLSNDYHSFRSSEATGTYHIIACTCETKSLTIIHACAFLEDFILNLSKAYTLTMITIPVMSVISLESIINKAEANNATLDISDVFPFRCQPWTLTARHVTPIVPVMNVLKISSSSPSKAVPGCIQT